MTRAVCMIEWHLAEVSWLEYNIHKYILLSELSHDIRTVVFLLPWNEPSYGHGEQVIFQTAHRVPTVAPKGQTALENAIKNYDETICRKGGGLFPPWPQPVCDYF